METPYDRSWWVDDGRLLGGCFPGSARPDTERAKLSALLDLGIRTFVSLMEPDERNSAGRPFADYTEPLRKLARSRELDGELEMHRFPIPDFGTAGPETIREILDTIDDSIGRDQPVYLHCWGGHGRTGMVVGCWLRESGLDAEMALSRITQLRRHSDYLRTMDAPQTEAQRDVIRSWDPRPRPARNG